MISVRNEGRASYLSAAGTTKPITLLDAWPWTTSPFRQGPD